MPRWQNRVHPTFASQLRLVKRLPKMRGFNNKFKVYYTAVNSGRQFDRASREAKLQRYTSESLAAAGLWIQDSIVIPGRGEISKPLQVKAHREQRRTRENRGG